ncbi:MAG: gamma-D-glutamyl-meso-diaminopimelate peptidase [Clostridia bacterium]|nr:gamma-D-glutamyl-meso-diaminopimelate peptidase [Clostridia bacterium]
MTEIPGRPDEAARRRILDELAGEYPALSRGVLGRSVLGREIPLLRLGEGKTHLLYVGAHHGAEGMTAAFLLRFLTEFLAAHRAGRSIEGVDPAFLLSVRTLWIVPALNPDGVELVERGLSSAGFLSERIRRMNGGSEDLSTWQANARGVDLNHNYDAGFRAYKGVESSLGILGGAPTRYSGEYPESEPETASLGRFIRSVPLSMILSFHTQGREIYFTSGGRALKGQAAVAARFAAMTGYRAAVPEGAAAYGGLTDWAVGRLGIPAFTVECGEGKNPLPASRFAPTYSEIRPLLFRAPLYAAPLSGESGEDKTRPKENERADGEHRGL